jgi:hypothetical protein
MKAIEPIVTAISSRCTNGIRLRLKQNEFILRTLCDCISFLYNQLSKQRHSNHDSSLVAGMLLDPDLAVYLSRVLKIETEMFDRSILERNPYELRIIIASNLNTQ